jgi:hypothetical protein
MEQYEDEDINNSFQSKNKHEQVKDIDVTEPAWVGDQLTGHRTYHVICSIGHESHKAIRRYSNFEALRNRLITECPQYIIPVIPPKRYKEKVVSDDSNEVQERTRGFRRFLTTIAEHEHLSKTNAFVEFMKRSEYATEASTPESSSLEGDTSTVTKYIFSVYESIVNKISGSDGSLTLKNKNELDFEFDQYLQKLKNLLDFAKRLHENSKESAELLDKENENCRNINSVIGNLQSSIKALDVEGTYDIDDETNDYSAFDEEEKKANFDVTFKKKQKDILKDSVDMQESESKNGKMLSQLIIDIEAGIDDLMASIDSIERRIKFKKVLETTKEDLGKLNNSSNEPGREKILKEERVKNLENDIKKIDKNLKEEVTKNIKGIEMKINCYISKLVIVRKDHLAVQKEHWIKIKHKYSPEKEGANLC